ncbi:unnamed protein product [Meloidogyne enterolobii]|uniref:Uncharacterized protein n=1 Tax=Meloidogyne enterolobii TaxID=390850 RepID=A0ACB0YE02_MELEN
MTVITEYLTDSHQRKVIFRGVMRIVITPTNLGGFFCRFLIFLKLFKINGALCSM